MSATDPLPPTTPEPDGADAVARAYVTIEQELTVLIRRARSFSAQMSREFHPDLEPGAYAMLLWLDDAGSARMTEMAAYFGIGKPTVSRQLQLMEKLDLITREVDENDRRAQRLTLTENGANLVHQARQARRASFKVRMADWTQEDLDRFAGLLSQLNEDLSRPTN
ncbi:MarR family winged helix-turn-helix transcriptional regulator [Kineosporia babensis]|uniref:MarR family transcriptional regulator n=1 Tax=Kineosporia babensis TaxID=499548 RepID=A0A9X1NNE4_9ACTN|nr:MarR family transcriptional regulator [Kineosporia babensis]